MTSLLVRTITIIGHQSTSLELSSNTRINTLWSAPACLSKIMKNETYVSKGNETLMKKIHIVTLGEGELWETNQRNRLTGRHR